ncbi:hypothetical protein [Martelella radicis]|uniref:Uncharacterized protein n=1 Tax=Martelella radicis TaxID=1397476 RepID=A0A7W6KMP8_9HYPH|nr:hypothetical protein [Martelella radicis]MBB4124154.1 hypothetical protein [Martelella radicis]
MALPVHRLPGILAINAMTGKSAVPSMVMFLSLGVGSSVPAIVIRAGKFQHAVNQKTERAAPGNLCSSDGENQHKNELSIGGSLQRRNIARLIAPAPNNAGSFPVTHCFTSLKVPLVRGGRIFPAEGQEMSAPRLRTFIICDQKSPD